MPLIPTPHVVSVTHRFDRERAGIDETNGMTDVQCWQVVTDQVSFKPIQACFAVDPLLNIVPPWYSIHQIYNFLQVTNMQPERDKASPFVHNVYITYSIPKFGGQPVGVDKWSIDIQVRGISETKTLLATSPQSGRYSGKSVAICNSRGMLYTGIEETYHDTEIIIKYTASSVDQAIFEECMDNYNGSAFNLTIGGNTFSYAAYTVRLVDYNVTDVVSVAPDGSTSTALPIVQLQFIQKKPAFSGDRPWDRKIPDTSDSPNGPVLLDGSGGFLALPAAPAPPVAVIYDGTGTTTNALGYPTIGEADFTALLNGIAT